MFLYNVYRVGCEVSPLLLTHGSQCSANRYIFKTDAYFPFLTTFIMLCVMLSEQAFRLSQLIVKLVEVR